MKPVDLIALLNDFYRDKLGLKRRHEAGAQQVSHYDFNNTYQYIIVREELHLTWVRAAIEGLDGLLQPAEPQEESVPRGQNEVLSADSARMQTFIERWQEPIGKITHARHRLMLGVVMGEAREHKRFFDQAVAGRTDLLGRRADGAGNDGEVLPTRWIE